MILPNKTLLKKYKYHSFFLLSLVLLSINNIEVNSTTLRDIKKKYGEKAMKINIKTQKNIFSNKEDLPVNIRVINNSNTSIEAPDPGKNTNWQTTYTLTGPSYPQGYSFNLHDLYQRKTNKKLKKSTSDTIKIEPNSYYDSVFWLNRIPFPEPGKHTLTLNLDWEGIQAQSNTITINIKPATFSLCQLVTEKIIGNSINIDLYCLQTIDTEKNIIKATFHENMQIMSVSIKSISVLAPLSSATQGIITPEAYSIETLTSPGILTEKTLSTINSSIKKSKITLDFTPDLILPASTDASGQMTLYILNTHDNSMSIISFAPSTQILPNSILSEPLEAPYSAQDKQNPDGTWSDPSPGKPEPGDPATLLWTVKLPNTPLYHRASIAPPGEDEKRGAVLVSAVNEGSVISVVRAAKDAPEPEIQHLSIKGLHPVADSVPDIYLTADGELHAAVILISPPVENQPVKVFLLHIAWDKKEGIAPEMQQREITQLPALPEAIAIAYSLAPGQANKISWAILQQNGQVLGNNAPDKPLNLNDEPILPLQLLSLDIGTFLLISDKENVFDFQRLY